MIAEPRAGLLLLPLLLLPACGSKDAAETAPRAATAATDYFPAEPNPSPPTAQPQYAEQFRADLAAERHPADGGGRAWLEESATGGTPVARVSTPGTWTIVFETGPLGVAEGGSVFLLIPPYWGWSWPQPEEPARPGFTEVTTEAEGVVLEPRLLDQGLLGVLVKGRGLAPGERLRFVYGAGPAGARADRFAERGSRFWVAVDGDGDGVRANIPDSPTVDVQAGPPRRLVLTVPSTAAEDVPLELNAAVLDHTGSLCTGFAGTVELESIPEGLVLPDALELGRDDRGARAAAVTADRSGVFRVVGHVKGDGDGVLFSAVSNPVAVAQDWPRIVWGDLHGHSNYSDGTGLPEDYYRYARDAAALDFATLTDHDHFGMPFLDASAELWDEIREQARRCNDPHRFVALSGYEWTSWIHGHRHVVYFHDDGVIYSSLDPAYETPALLWAALRGQAALTFAHHSAGGPIAVNWSYAPDPELEPVTEVCSVHGTSEALDSPCVLPHPVRGNMVRDCLDHGYEFGFVGSGDSHDGHPGLAHLGGPTGGLAAVFTEDLTRQGILAALRERRCYATSGARILLDVRLDGAPMGSSLPAAREDAAGELTVRVIGTGPLAGIEVIRSGERVEVLACEQGFEMETTFHLAGLRAGEYVYVRIQQFDLEDPERLHLAWSSPIFLR